MAKHKIKDSQGNWHWFDSDEEYLKWQNKNNPGCWTIIIAIIAIIYFSINGNFDKKTKNEDSTKIEKTESTKDDNIKETQPIDVSMKDNPKLESATTDTSYLQTDIEEIQEDVNLQPATDDSSITEETFDETVDIDALLAKFEETIYRFETASFSEYESARSEAMLYLSKVQSVKDKMSRKQKRHCRKLIERIEKEQINYNNTIQSCSANR